MNYNTARKRTKPRSSGRGGQKMEERKRKRNRKTEKERKMAMVLAVKGRTYEDNIVRVARRVANKCVLQRRDKFPFFFHYEQNTQSKSELYTVYSYISNTERPFGMQFVFRGVTPTCTPITHT